jgi:hypothetical protein
MELPYTAFSDKRTRVVTATMEFVKATMPHLPPAKSGNAHPLASTLKFLGKYRPLRDGTWQGRQARRAQLAYFT